MAATDLAQSILTVLRALATNPSTAVVDALRSVTSGAAVEVARIAEQAQAIAAQARAAAQQQQEVLSTALADAQAQVDASTADFQARIATAEQAVDNAAVRGQEAVVAARQQAQQLRAGALASTIDQAERDAVEQRAQQMVTAAEQAAQQIGTDAQQLLTALTAESAAKLTELQTALAAASADVAAAVERVSQLAATIQQDVAAEVARLEAAAVQVAAQVTALPGQALALAEDARRQVVDALGQQASLIGLVTQALVYLKDQLFPDEPNLQVVAYSDPNAPGPGVGLSWVNADVKALLAYVPGLGGPLGSLVIHTSRDGGEAIEITTGSPVQIGLKASGNQSTVITFGAPVAPAAEIDVELFADFDTSSLRLDERFLQAHVGTPHLSIRIRFTGGAWRYKASGSLNNAGWDVDFARLLAPIPNLFPLPDFGESRTFGVTLEDGVFTYVETDAA